MDRETAAELFSAFGAVDVRRVFSGFGIYAEDICFALYLRGEFYLKADETTIPRFVAEGCEPFRYATRAKTVSVNSYWRMPSRLYDDPEELADWAREAVAVAAKVKLKKQTQKRKSAAASARKDGAAPAMLVRGKRAPGRSSASRSTGRSGTPKRR